MKNLIVIFAIVLVSSFSVFAGNTNSDSHKKSCNADFNYSVQLVGTESNETITLIPTSNVNFQAPKNLADKESLTYFWSFGDGHSTTQANPSHTFNYCGNYDVTLTIIDSSGKLLANTVSKSIDIDGLCLDIDTGAVGMK